MKDESSCEVFVHIVLKDWARKDDAAREQAVEAIVRVSDLRDLNQKRLRRFGIVSGRIHRDRLALLKALSAMESVSEDTERQAV
jgi:hypothetical protein